MVNNERVVYSRPHCARTFFDAHRFISGSGRTRESNVPLRRIHLPNCNSESSYSPFAARSCSVYTAYFYHYSFTTIPGQIRIVSIAQRYFRVTIFYFFFLFTFRCRFPLTNEESPIITSVHVGRSFGASVSRDNNRPTVAH